MKQQELVSGFSELKDLLIRTYGVNRSREFVRLYFSVSGNRLLMHDYVDHKKAIVICNDLASKNIPEGFSPGIQKLVAESLMHLSPTDFLNNEFQLNGFFRS